MKALRVTINRSIEYEWISGGVRVPFRIFETTTISVHVNNKNVRKRENYASRRNLMYNFLVSFEIRYIYSR